MKHLTLAVAIFLGCTTLTFAQEKKAEGAKKTVTHNNPEAEKHYNNGVYKSNEGHYKEALVEFEQAIKLDPKNSRYLTKRAFCLVQTGEYKAAIADYDVVLKEHPDDVFAFISRGSAKNKIKDFKGAIVDFDKALALDPKNTEALNNRGWAKKGMGDYEGACKDWKKSKKLGNVDAKLFLENNHC